MSEPSKAALAFATGIYAEMFGHVSTDPADVSRMVVLAIAFESTAKTSHDAVLAEREACAKAVESLGTYDAYGIRVMCAEAIRARGTK